MMSTWFARAQFVVQNPKGALLSLSRRIPILKTPIGWTVSYFSDEQTRLFYKVERLVQDGQYIEAAKAYRAAISIDPERSAVYATGLRFAEKGRLSDDFYVALVDQIQIGDLREMFKHIANTPDIFQPSHFWLYFMTYNALQIETGGIENFKRTVNNNYFNWTADANVSEQYAAVVGVSDSRKDESPGANRYFQYLWALYEFTKRHDELRLLDILTEPEIGNPIYLDKNKVRISQDLCNTTLDLNTIITNAGLNRDSTFTVYELGSGCGRIGYGLVSSFPNARYVAIDIPPALYVAQWYLGSLFPEQATFKFREFSTYAEVRAEFERSRIAFLSPDQAALLPDKSCDIFVNICSLQEMTYQHVVHWFDEVDRLCGGFFYSKQFKRHYNVVDHFYLNEDDYPAKKTWHTVMKRENPTFPSLFEVVYKI